MDLVFENVTKNFGTISALNDVSLHIKSGEFAFIVGQSGAGKSTILKLILGQTRPTEGNVLINGINLFGEGKRQTDVTRRKIGVIFQDYQLISDKTVEENISLALDIVSFPENKTLQRIDEVLKQVGLESRRHLFPSQLSGGELQRASLARAISVYPELILADEPTGNLDLENTWSLIKLLKDINKSLHATIIMTTHNMDIVESFNFQVIKLHNGKIIK